jgi:hypothetical protein
VFRGCEFEGNDLAIELWLLEVVRQIDNGAAIDAWLKELRDEWYLQATAGFGFGPTPQLDRFVGSDVQQQRLAKLFNQTLDALVGRHGDYSPEELQQSGVGGSSVFYSGAFSTDAVIAVGKLFLKLSNVPVNE